MILRPRSGVLSAPLDFYRADLNAFIGSTSKLFWQARQRRAIGLDAE